MGSNIDLRVQTGLMHRLTEDSKATPGTQVRFNRICTRAPGSKRQCVKMTTYKTDNVHRETQIDKTDKRQTDQEKCGSPVIEAYGPVGTMLTGFKKPPELRSVGESHC